MKVKPLSDRIVVKRSEAEDKTEFSIVIPGLSVDKPDGGEVISIGSTELVKVGDKIIFGKYAGQAFKLEGIEYLTLRESDIVAKFN